MLIAFSFLVNPLIAGPSSATICTLGSAPGTLSEAIERYDVVLLVQWHHTIKGIGVKPGRTTYEVLDVLRALHPGPPLKGELVELVHHREGTNTDLFLVFGTIDNELQWEYSERINLNVYEYLWQAPSPKLPVRKRLAFFVKYLEDPDPQIATDAHAEFEQASYDDIKVLAHDFPRDRLRAALADNDWSRGRIRLYGIMLGICGSSNDAEEMRRYIASPSEGDFRVGIDGVIAGYLLLTGEAGLNFIEDTRLHNKTVPFSETYAAMQALRFMWQNGDDRISLERLRQSMRILIDRPELAELVIADLARWKDWESQERLAALYGSKEYNTLAIKRAIVRFLLKSMRDIPEMGEDVRNSDVKLPQHAIRGEALLEEIRQKDPITVAQVEKYFFWLKSP
ncbi:MAG: hypothetical protein O2955_06180 [Planctomycetota bacterium]|nr:hypothetical protein [Planctomycetota bacterium]MDA1212082.1 hypothetical protein [Planctomycetota bacterium]